MERTIISIAYGFFAFIVTLGVCKVFGMLGLYMEPPFALGVSAGTGFGHFLTRLFKRD